MLFSDIELEEFVSMIVTNSQIWEMPPDLNEEYLIKYNWDYDLRNSALDTLFLWYKKRIEDCLDKNILAIELDWAYSICSEVAKKYNMFESMAFYEVGCLSNYIKPEILASEQVQQVLKRYLEAAMSYIVDRHQWNVDYQKHVDGLMNAGWRNEKINIQKSTN